MPVPAEPAAPYISFSRRRPSTSLGISVPKGSATAADEIRKTIVAIIVAIIVIITIIAIIAIIVVVIIIG